MGNNRNAIMLPQRIHGVPSNCLATAVTPAIAAEQISTFYMD